MIRKFILLVIGLSLSILVGCSQNYIDMAYIKVPSSVVLVGNKNKAEIDKLVQDLKKLKQNDNNYKQQSIPLVGRIADLTKEESMEISDKEFISKITTEIKNKKGISTNFLDTKYVSNNAIYDVKLEYDGINISDGQMKEGYIPDIYIYDDGTAITTKYDSNSNLIAVKVILDKSIIDYIKNYYQTH